MFAKRYSLDESTVGLVSYLKKVELNNLHRSDRHKEVVDLYSVLGLVETRGDGSVKLQGHLFAPKGAEVKYSVSYYAGKPAQIDILKKTSGMNTAEAIRMVEAEIEKLYKKARTQKKRGGGGKNLKGYYLWCELPRAKGLMRFAEAKALSLVSDAFINTCVEIKMSMRRYN